MTKTPRVAIIIPAYNESFTLGKLISTLRQTLKAEKIFFEIIVIDDHSTDDTARCAEKAGAYVIRHILNTGSGGATATGLSYAKKNNFDVAATLDADGQHDPKDLRKGIQYILKNDDDLLIGSRLMTAGGMPKIKILGNKGLGIITYCLYGVNVSDSQSGLRIFSHRALQRLKWKTYGYGFCSEMLWRAKQENLKINEFPIQAIYTDYSKKKGQNNWNAVHIIRSLLKWRIMEFLGE